MFSALDQYMDESFCKEHDIICFDTLTERAQYQVLAVFKTALYTDDVFPYYDFTDAQDASAYDSYVAGCKDISLYDTGVTASYGDRLLTLSTCEYSEENGRLVVVAKKIMDSK
jgi:sortase B